MSGKLTVELIGRLARDPESRYTPEGKAVTTFTIPVQERKDGDTTWVKVTAWERQAETLQQYAAKGTWLWVRGVPKIETWQDKSSGETKHAFSVTLREFTFCGGGEQNGNGETEPQQPARQQAGRYEPPGPQQAQQRTQRNVPQAVEDDRDLPF